MKTDLSQTLQKLDFDPIILQDNAQTLSDYTHVSFAIILLSQDDLAYSTEKTSDEAKYRANQNIFFALGYFLGRLVKQNVIAVLAKKKKDFEIPNSYSGVAWIEYKTGWYFELIRELKAANFDVDANKLGWL